VNLSWINPGLLAQFFIVEQYLGRDVVGQPVIFPIEAEILDGGRVESIFKAILSDSLSDVLTDA
jgi:hypothetical protein